MIKEEKDYERNFLHDLSSPLAGVQLVLETLVADVPKGDPTGMLRRIEIALRGVEKMKRLMEVRREDLLG
jgi:hypothetical protein